MIYPDRIHLGQWTLPGGLYILMWLQNKPWIWSSTLFVPVCIPAHLYGVATMKGLIYIYFQVRYVGPCFTMYVYASCDTYRLILTDIGAPDWLPSVGYNPVIPNC